MEFSRQVDLLLAHFDALALVPATEGRGWNHMGAVLADAALQRRTKFRSVVEPRVRGLIEAWPDADTVTGLAARMSQEDVAVVLRWRHPAKIMVLRGLTEAMQDLRIETVSDLHSRFNEENEAIQLRQRLRQVHGVGPKTVDYLAILAGSRSEVAIDTHLSRFTADAGLPQLSYAKLRDVVKEAARRRGCGAGELDTAIWAFKSGEAS